MMILSYLGSKASMMPYLDEIISPLLTPNTVFGDLFMGTGCVSQFFKNKTKKVIASDLEVYSHVLGKALLQTVYTDKLQSIIEEMNAERIPVKKGLIWYHFTPHSPPQHSKMFFTCENGVRIDSCRQYISQLHAQKMINYKEFVFLLASIITSASKYSNTSGTFRAYLKQFYSRALKSFKIHPVHTNRVLYNKNMVYQADANSVAKNKKFDVVYLDPPYTPAQYGGYYSLLNYLCLYDNKTPLSGVGVIPTYNRSHFSSSKHAFTSLNDLIRSISSRFIILSYNSKGILSLQQLKYCLSQKGSVRLFKVIHKNYKPHLGIKQHNVVEYIFLIDTCGTVGSFEETWMHK
jgi:adenine-specific DNA-methyltransferase